MGVAEEALVLGERAATEGAEAEVVECVGEGVTGCGGEDTATGVTDEMVIGCGGDDGGLGRALETDAIGEGRAGKVMDVAGFPEEGEEGVDDAVEDESKRWDRVGDVGVGGGNAEGGEPGGG